MSGMAVGPRHPSAAHLGSFQTGVVGAGLEVAGTDLRPGTSSWGAHRLSLVRGPATSREGIFPARDSHTGGLGAEVLGVG